MDFKERKRTLYGLCPISFTTYSGNTELVKVRKAFLMVHEDKCHMYRINDVKLKANPIQRLCRCATVILYTSDTTCPEIHLINIKNAESIRDFIFRTSDEERRKRMMIYQGL